MTSSRRRPRFSRGPQAENIFEGRLTRTRVSIIRRVHFNPDGDALMERLYLQSKQAGAETPRDARLRVEEVDSG